MIFIAGMEEKEKFKTYRQILSFLIFFELLGILGNGCVQQVEYILFKSNSANYILAEANVIKKEDDVFKIMSLELVPISRAFIKYEIEGETYEKWTLSYPRCYEGEKIVIAVSTKDYSKLIRAVPYEITDTDKKIYFKQIVIMFILISIIILLVIIEKHRKETEKYNLF